MAAQLAYTVHPGQGPYLLLLHGFLSSARQWLLNLDALSEVCRPVTVDLWGHGDSPTPEDPALYAPLAYIERLEQIRTALNTDTWIVCGYSLGAGITIRYAHVHPERVGAHIFTNSQSGLASAALIAEWSAGADEAAAKILAHGRQAIRRIPVHPRFAKRVPEPVRGALLEDAEKLSPLGIAHCMRYTNPSVSARNIAPANPRPALLCFGTHEKRFHDSKTWAETHMARLTVAELDAGHAVNMEDAPGFNTAVSEFIHAHAA